MQIKHVICNINRLNVKNHIIITRDIEKASASLKQLYDSVLKKIGIDGTYFKIIKVSHMTKAQTFYKLGRIEGTNSNICNKTKVTTLLPLLNTTIKAFV